MKKIISGRETREIIVLPETLLTDGREIAARLIRLDESGSFLVRIDGHTHAGFFRRDESGRMQISVDGFHFSLKSVSPGAGGSGSSSGDIVSPLPGKIIRVMVSPGEAVSKDQILVVEEAMKMEHSLRAGRDGKVAEILVKPGDQVNPEQVLIRLEKVE